MDPILVSVVERSLANVTEEMGLVLLRTTRSPIFSEARDFVTGVYDPSGRILAQMEYIPILAFAVPQALRAVIAFFGDDIHPGDVFVANDVFYGGNQSADISVFRPMFCGGRLVFWLASKGHHADLGGSAVGGYNPQAREVWQETVRITPLKVYARGELRADVWELLLANTRLPDIVGGDLQAQIGAALVGERRMQELVDRYGLDRLQELIAEVLTTTERRMRLEIARIPDGAYTGEAWLDHDAGQAGQVRRVAVTITVAGERIRFDYTGTDPQAPTYVNAPLAATQSVTMLTLLMCVDPDLPHNEGLVVPVAIHAPEGCLLNARFPAATAHGNFTCSDAIPDAIFRALAPVLPHRVTAGWQRFFGGPIGGIDPRTGRPSLDTTFFSGKGGGGGTYGADGWSHIGMIGCAGGVRAQDYEMHELQMPHIVLRHEFWPDSEGAGRWRGGFGVHTQLYTYAVDPFHNIHGDGGQAQTRPFGLCGGESGAANRCLLHFPDGKTVQAELKANYQLATGTILECFVGGGGGFGDPRERDEARVVDEVQSGLISPARARSLYGVAVDPDTLRPDPVATAALRQRSKEAHK